MAVPPEVKISPYVIGFDFGTTNSVAAIYKRGAPQVLPIEGERLFPSVVYFQEDGTPLAGRQAKNYALIYPERTITSVKMRLGDPGWVFRLNGRAYTATEIASVIIGCVIEGIQNQDQVDLEGNVRKVILCVPANFQPDKREEVKRAAENAGAENAGLEVVDILDEPVAAAYAYAHTLGNVDQKILVYDLGGGTFDVSILEVKASFDPSRRDTYRVLPTEGIPHLGGDDFDSRIIAVLAAKLRQSSGINIFDLECDQGVSRRKLLEAKQILKELAERAKIELTTATTTTIQHPAILTDGAGQSHGVSYELTRDKFEALTKDLLNSEHRFDAEQAMRASLEEGFPPDEADRIIRELLGEEGRWGTEQALDAALEAANLSRDEIDRTILVGGASNMPMVKEQVTRYFGREPYTNIDPLTIVAHGAALYGAGVVEPVQAITRYHLGIEIKGQRFSRLIPKLTPLYDEQGNPRSAKKTEQYSTPRPGIHFVQIPVWTVNDFSEGQIKYVTDADAHCLGEFFLEIPEEYRREDECETVEVTMELTFRPANLLRVTAQIVKDGEPISETYEVSLRR